MKRVLLALMLMAAVVPTALADITVTTSVSILAANMTVDGTMTTYAKGAKFRADTNVANQNVSIIGDAAAKQQWSVNHTTKTIEPLSQMPATLALPITFGEPKVSVTPNGETRQVLGRACHGYAVDVTMPMTVGGETITMKMTGPAWVSKDGAGVAEYQAAQKTLSHGGISTAVIAQGPQGKAMAEVTKALADAGMVLEQELKMTLGGTGPMAQMMGQAAGATISLKVTAIATDAIPDATFALPEGYTKK